MTRFRKTRVTFGQYVGPHVYVENQLAVICQVVVCE